MSLFTDVFFAGDASNSKDKDNVENCESQTQILTTDNYFGLSGKQIDHKKHADLQ